MNISRESRNHGNSKNRVPLLLIRTDANTRMGTGHVMRCLALAQAWQGAGGRARFLMATQVQALEAKLITTGVEVLYLSAPTGSTEDAQETSRIATQNSANWIVTDGYQFGADYQQTIKDAGLRLLSIDDYGHAEKYFADLVLNQNISASKKLYSKREPYTRLLLGTRFALLRREFRNWKEKERKIPEVAQKVLVTLGGADPDNVTLKVVQALQKVDILDLEAKIIVGPSNPHLKSLQYAVRCAPWSVVVLKNANDMPELMAWADIAVSGGGATCWELAYMGLPNLILVLAENQAPIAEGLEKAGIAVNLGWHEDVEINSVVQALKWILFKKETRTQMSQRGRSTVDGIGAMRVCDRLLENER